ncbi:hypothetical protein B1207_09530 [Legionella quinlivanii]|uniref:RNA polymerase sigma factor n=1 Tax=Legionella quinlivanii TaxID=45073 RepID=A0A364LIV1_9GAMM|nr:sigma-70 family RNA polymerase sigma factor [Legionella quinlivanii]RAP36368.1 hypothetical protein B1207_09530 [Legionella quinlivanii]
MAALEKDLDRELVNQARSGERAAIGRLLCHYRPSIVYQIRAQVDEMADVEDLAQEVCIKVFRFINQFDHKANFKTWLYKITQTTIINYYRSRRLDTVEIFNEEPDTQDSSPEQEAIRLELSEKITRFLLSLPETLQKCFYLYSVLGLAYEEIARRMHCPLGTVRSRIHRIRSTILVILK